MSNRKENLKQADQAETLAAAGNQQTRFTVHTIVHNCFAEKNLDAVVYPSGNIPPAIATSPQEPSINDRGSNWTTISKHGFPVMTVPAGFTTQVYDRGPDGELQPPVPARLPVGMDILALPFDEPTVFVIGDAFEDATRHREQPPGFGPLSGPEQSETRNE